MTTSTWGGRHVHDPTVVRDDDGTYWMFSTDARSDGPVRAGVQMRTSRDLVRWEFHGWALDSVPGPAAAWSLAEGLWAPDVVRSGEPGPAEWRMYYSASTFGSRRSAIGLATAPHPSGPWTDRGLVVASDHVDGPAGLGHPNAIDANLVTEYSGGHSGGCQWLVYGSFFGGIYALPVDPSTGLVVDPSTGLAVDPSTELVVDAPASGALRDAPGTLLARRARAADGAVEGAFVLPRPDGGWALLVSYDSLAGTYHLRTAVGDQVTGPFRDRAGRLMTDGAVGNGGAASDVDPWQVGVPVLASHRLAGGPGILAPGHASVLTEPGRQLLVHHVRDADAPTEHRVQVRRLVWTHDGWPLVSPQPWAGPARENDDATTWPTSQGVFGGTWEALDVGSAPAQVADGRTGPLARVLDGALSDVGQARSHGAGRFTWGRPGDAPASARRWTAVVFPAWDAVRDRATLCLTATNDAGRTVTGTKVSNE